MTSLTAMLKCEAEDMYRVTENLVRKLEPADLGWKPSTGRNWMSVGQLLKHLTEACGGATKGLVTGDWGLPPGVKMEDMKPEDMLPPAERMPAVTSVQEALDLLAQDRKMALHYIAEAGEKNLFDKQLTAPWGGPEQPLGMHLWHMIQHLGQHKGQLFYYLKLMGRPVHTGDLWGM